MAATLPSRTTATAPSLASRLARFSAEARPWTRSNDGGFHVAVALFESPLRVHHADARCLAQILYVFGGDCHLEFSSSKCGWGYAPTAVADGVTATAGRFWRIKRPSVTASAIKRHSNAPARIASSLPGMT